MVPRAGLEPARSCLRGILNPLCLPIPPPGQLRGLYTFFITKLIYWLEAEAGIEPAYTDLQSAA